jgi:hypothetical protein
MSQLELQKEKKKWWQRQDARIKTAKKRMDTVLKECGCVCHCPKCYDILNDQADCRDDKEDGVFYKCNTCGTCSHWNFDIAPVPVLLREFEKEHK